MRLFVGIGIVPAVLLGLLAVTALAGLGALLLAWPELLALWLFPGSALAAVLGWIGTGVWLLVLLLGLLGGPVRARL
jgi:hypothetical protein